MEKSPILYDREEFDQWYRTLNWDRIEFEGELPWKYPCIVVYFSYHDEFDFICKMEYVYQTDFTRPERPNDDGIDF